MDKLYNYVRTYFFSSNWNDVYEFLEVVVYYFNDSQEPSKNENFQKACNFVLEREFFAYRFVRWKNYSNYI